MPDHTGHPQRAPLPLALWQSPPHGTDPGGKKQTKKETPKKQQQKTTNAQEKALEGGPGGGTGRGLEQHSGISGSARPATAAVPRARPHTWAAAPLRPRGCKRGLGRGQRGQRRLLPPMLHARSRRRLPPPALRDRGGLGASAGHRTGYGHTRSPTPPGQPRSRHWGHLPSLPRCSGRKALLGPAAAAAPEDEHAKRERSGAGAARPRVSTARPRRPQAAPARTGTNTRPYPALPAVMPGSRRGPRYRADRRPHRPAPGRTGAARGRAEGAARGTPSPTPTSWPCPGGSSPAPSPRPAPSPPPHGAGRPLPRERGRDGFGRFPMGAEGCRHPPLSPASSAEPCTHSAQLPGPVLHPAPPPLPLGTARAGRGGRGACVERRAAGGHGGDPTMMGGVARGHSHLGVILRGGGTWGLTSRGGDQGRGGASLGRSQLQGDVTGRRSCRGANEVSQLRVTPRGPHTRGHHIGGGAVTLGEATGGSHIWE